MINQSAYLPLEKKIISNKNRFKLFKKDLVEIKKILKQKFKNYNFSNKVLKVSKTI